ncbi:hypothetical protein FHS27_006530 [Rhodopirellula rubra]|uniref:Uncharacterized protein n=1 Tax=Aporhodopirellula rubra TaxID=980271 RepID=A0A7W5H8H2_9BACT|nr:hypothetical protein [Aporhodopirellula rubra]
MTCTGARLAAFFAMESQPSVPRDVRRSRSIRKHMDGYDEMKSKRYSISALFLFVTCAGIALAPVNRNTASGIWYTINPQNAPSGGRFNSGTQWHNIPYDYGDTWFSRYRQLNVWLCPPARLAITPPIIIDEEEEEYGVANDFDTPSPRLAPNAD